MAKDCLQLKACFSKLSLRPKLVFPRVAFPKDCPAILQGGEDVLHYDRAMYDQGFIIRQWSRDLLLIKGSNRWYAARKLVVCQTAEKLMQRWKKVHWYCRYCHVLQECHGAILAPCLKHLEIYKNMLNYFKLIRSTHSIWCRCLHCLSHHVSCLFAFYLTTIESKTRQIQALKMSGPSCNGRTRCKWPQKTYGFCVWLCLHWYPEPWLLAGIQ